MKNIANFLFEAGMLKRTPRTGFQFLGSGAESVAEHIFRTTYIGFALGKMAKGVNADRIIKMCLFHDLPEARTGDQNYVNKKYVEVNERKAIDDMARTLSQRAREDSRKSGPGITSSRTSGNPSAPRKTARWN